MLVFAGWMEAGWLASSPTSPRLMKRSKVRNTVKHIHSCVGHEKSKCSRKLITAGLFLSYFLRSWCCHWHLIGTSNIRTHLRMSIRAVSYFQHYDMWEYVKRLALQSVNHDASDRYVEEMRSLLDLRQAIPYKFHLWSSINTLEIIEISNDPFLVLDDKMYAVRVPKSGSFFLASSISSLFKTLFFPQSKLPS